MTRYIAGFMIVVMIAVFANSARAADPAVEYKEKLAELEAGEAELHFKLGVKLYKANAFNEAANEFTRALRLKSDYPKATEYLEKPKPFRTLYDYDTLVITYWNTLAKIRTDTAKEYVSLAKWAKKKKLGEEAKACYGKAMAANPDNKDARKAMDYTYLKPYGWVADADAKNLKKGLLPFEGKWLKAREAEIKHSEWANAWVLESAHYKLTTNVKYLEALEILRELESFFRLWDDYLLTFKDGWKREGKMEVWYARTRDDLLTNAPEAAKATLQLEGAYGVFWAQTGIAYFFKETGDDEQGYQALYHECTHQVFAGFREAEDKDKAGLRGYWSAEAVAVFAERYEEKNNVPSFLKKTKRYEQTKRDFAEGKLISAAEIEQATKAEFASGDARKFYMTAMGLGHFLMFHNGGKHRENFFKYVIAVEKGLGSDKLFRDTFDFLPGDIEADFKYFMRKF